MGEGTKRWLIWLWLAAVCAFAALHGWHLSADFPNRTPWLDDFAKYTDEGWYGNAAIRAHLFGNWYMPGDFNPAPAVPVWPLLEWLLFFATGVTVEAARGLAVFFFVLNLVLSYALLRTRAPRWAALLAVTLLVTSPFLYSFSRLAILEPMLTCFTLAALNLAVRLPGMKRPYVASAGIGLLFALMLLTKTTAVFLLPALGWAMLVPLRAEWRKAARCALTAAEAAVVSFGAWMALVMHAGLMRDYHYLFFINKYEKPTEFYWPLLSLWWSFHGGLWVDHLLIPLAGAVFLLVAACVRQAWARALVLDGVFGASVLAVAGYILFMTYQNHPQPRYFAVVAFFSFFVVAQGAATLLRQGAGPLRTVGRGVLTVALIATAVNAAWTVSYAAQPEYTFVNAARNLTRYIDAHPNGNRLLVSISGDEITLMTHLPTLCDDFGTDDLPVKLARYKPGWYATWNALDPGTLEDLHVHYQLEQVAAFRALDNPDRDVLVLFKLHPLPGGEVREPTEENLRVTLPGDKIDIPIE